MSLPKLGMIQDGRFYRMQLYCVRQRAHYFVPKHNIHPDLIRIEHKLVTVVIFNLINSIPPIICLRVTFHWTQGSKAESDWLFILVYYHLIGSSFAVAKS
eukprot:snap_masked-scaffold_35-processed-gene-0.1-mRNA-1 protein AED:1.00 eAED:1.00 QI:0/0/0/0/1/1/2/0/99